MTPDLKPPPLPTSSSSFPTQRALFGLVSVALGVAVTLWWLRGIVGGFAAQIFWRLTFSQDLPVAWAMAWATFGMALMSGPLRRGPRLSSLAVSEWIDRYIAWIALAMLPFYAAIALFAGHLHAFSEDEVSVVAQSQIFAAGHLSATISPGLLNWVIPAEYQAHFFQVSHAPGALISSYWPGFALLLTPFSALNVPWLCNPVLTCLSVWALHRATIALFECKIAAAWAVVFFVVSPVIALNAATFYTMPAHQLANIGFCWLLARKTRGRALSAGLLGGFALFLHNPAPHGLFALPWILWVALRQRALLGPLLLGYLFLLPLGYEWSVHLGTFETGHQLLSNSSGSMPTPAPGHQLWARLPEIFALPSLALCLVRVAGLCKLAVWAAPGLMIWAVLGAKSASQNVSHNAFLRLLSASLLLTFVAFMFVRFAQGAGWGFRYLHQVWFVLPMLAGVFFSRSEAASPALRRVAALGAALSLLVFLPWRVMQVEGFMRENLAQIPAPSPARASLTFIRVQHGFQTAALVQNDPFLRGSHWKLVDQGTAADARLARQFLAAPRRDQSGDWGEIWVGKALKSLDFRSKSGSKRTR